MQPDAIRFMSAESMLESKQTSLLIIEPRKETKVVIGVPHHAPAGVTKLPCPEHEDSDENTGFLGRYIAEALQCSSIIACNYTMDVNKCNRTDYAIQIAKWKPKILIEIHGHKGRANHGKANYDIEISSGSLGREQHSKQVAKQLETAFTNSDLEQHTICGEFLKINFKASSSVTITDERWIAYHIELPPELRKPCNGSSGKPPPIGYQFCNALISAIKVIHEL